MNTTPNCDRRKTFNEADRRKRRDIARDVWAAYRAVAQVAGFFPIEIRTAEAVSLCHYEVTGQDYDRPRGIKLLLVGAVLSSYGESDKGKVNTASNRTSQLFTHAQPRTGYQLLTRYKALEDNKAHEYVDHIMPVAEVVAAYHAEERAAILKDGQPNKQARIAEARERLAAEALTLLPKCDAELLDENGEVYAYLSDAEAKTYSTRNPNFKAQAKTARPKRPLCREDFDRIEGKLRSWIEDELEDALARNSFDEARWFADRLESSIPKGIRSWVKVAGAPTSGGDDRDRGIHEVSEVGGQDADEPPEPDAEMGADVERGAPQELGGAAPVSELDSNDLIFDDLQTPETVPPTVAVGSVNFDDSLEAALFYVRDGWAVVPCCQFDPVTGRCTGPDSHHDDGICRGKVPLIKGKKPIPGAGYTAASRDKGLIRDWFTRQFPDAGVAIRLDGHILIDCDVKDGAPGLESYQILADTFNLSATLSSVTPSGGRHYIFKLPEGLPPDFLGSWTRVLDSAELGGIDIKVGNKGLAHEEPSRGAAGAYRWIDPAAEIAELPRAVCDYFHEVHEAQRRKPESMAHEGSLNAQPFDPGEDQAKFFKDAPAGERRPRLRSIACCLAAGGANEEQIVTVLKYHDKHFTQPTNDAKFIAKVASGAVSKFGQGVTS